MPFLAELRRRNVFRVAAAYLVVGWLLTEVGWDPRGSVFGTYVQRNALVVGIAMGFAVIPIIYTFSEDALVSVPDHLRAASLGAGATPWQTAVRIGEMWDGDDVEIRYIKDGDHRLSRPQDLERLEALPWVRTFGHMDDVERLLAQVDIVALPSYREGTPKILLEAAACGLPIV